MCLGTFIKIFQKQHGTALVEFAISFPLFIFTVFTCIDFAFMQRDIANLEITALGAGRNGAVTGASAAAQIVSMCTDGTMNDSEARTCHNFYNNFKSLGYDLEKIDDNIDERNIIATVPLPPSANNAKGIYIKQYSSVANSDCQSIYVQIHWTLDSIVGSPLNLGLQGLKTIKKNYCFPIESSLAESGCSPVAMQKECLDYYKAANPA